MNFVYALDAATGKPVPRFGKDGRIDLREDLVRNPAEQVIYLTSPAVIYKDLMIVGGRVSDTLPASDGDIRAYEVRTGKLRWAFHTIPRPGEFGDDTWPKDAWKSTGAVNNWTGNDPRPEHRNHLHPDRLGSRFHSMVETASAMTCSRTACLPSMPRPASAYGISRVCITTSGTGIFPLLQSWSTLNHDGQKVEALAQNSKQGFVFLFDRANGKPIFPLDCREYPPAMSPARSRRNSNACPLSLLLMRGSC